MLKLIFDFIISEEGGNIPNEDKVIHRLKLRIYEKEWQEPRCPEGQYFVHGYQARNGAYVRGYCKKNSKRKFSFISPMKIAKSK